MAPDMVEEGKNPIEKKMHFREGESPERGKNIRAGESQETGPPPLKRKRVYVNRKGGGEEKNGKKPFHPSTSRPSSGHGGNRGTGGKKRKGLGEEK